MTLFSFKRMSSDIRLQKLSDEQGNAKVIVVTIICCVLIVLLVLAIIFREPIGEFLNDFSKKYLDFSNLGSK